jgi:hypothetical protein
VDHDGNVIVTGWFSGSAQFGALPPVPSTGPLDLFVAKLEPTMGDCTWVVDVTGSFTGPLPLSVVADGDGNAIVAGTIKGLVAFDSGSTDGGLISTSAGDTDAFVVKLDPNGAFQWARAFEGHPLSTANGVTVDPAGNILVTGGFNASVDLGCGPLMGSGPSPGGAFLAKLSPAGTAIWATTMGGGNPPASAPVGNSVAMDGTGNTYVAGDFSGSIDFGSGPIMGPPKSVFIAKLNPP